MSTLTEPLLSNLTLGERLCYADTQPEVIRPEFVQELGTEMEQLRSRVQTLEDERSQNEVELAEEVERLTAAMLKFNDKMDSIADAIDQAKVDDQLTAKDFFEELESHLHWEEP